jgi:hypothetical protein
MERKGYWAYNGYIAAGDVRQCVEIGAGHQSRTLTCWSPATEPGTRWHMHNERENSAQFGDGY